ncbi:DUF7620 family protein [Hoyosella altamirensis]|uniref:DUF7620 family protein n=1 Tax=Hoyosella altamirensis TaxID=616997 RepID=UPI0007DB562E|nr:hypothetical protein [Hoyosella altamirensis]
MSIFRRLFRLLGEEQSVAAVAESVESLRQVQTQRAAVEDITGRLRDEQKRNHFGEAIADAMRRK